VDLSDIPASAPRPGGPSFGRPPFGRPAFGAPPFGPPPFGGPPFGGPPPEGFEMPLADVSHISRKWLDLPYAPVSAAQQLDIYLPENGDGPFPVLLSIHGGAFAIGDKRDIHVTPFLRGLDRGYAVVSLNYRLSGEAVFPAGIQDVKTAVRWLRAHAQDYSLDGGRIVAWGGSSGANYAAMMAVTLGDPFFDDPALGHPDCSSDVQLAVDWFGPTDFLTMDKQLADSGLGPADHSEDISPESRYLGAAITAVPEKVRLASPITHVSERMAPILIQHGRADNVVPFQQSVQFAEAIEARASADRFELDLFDSAVHDDPVFESDHNLERVFEFIAGRLR
jgi:acetyl esterase/lipase